jgi:hypothetical protein
MKKMSKLDVPEESIQLANSCLPMQTTHTYSSFPATVLQDGAFPNMPPYTVHVMTEDEENQQIKRTPEKSIQLANTRLPAQATHAYSSSSATVLPDGAFPNMPPHALRLIRERLQGSSTLLPKLPPRAQEMSNIQQYYSRYI